MSNSADEVFSKLTQFDESKHHRNHGQFSSNGGGGRDHGAGALRGAKIGVLSGGALGGLHGAAVGGHFDGGTGALIGGGLGAAEGAIKGGLLGAGIGAIVGRKKTKEESQAFVEGAKAAHEHNHGKDDGVAKNYVSTDVEEVFKSARGVVKPVSDALNGVGNAIQGAAKNPKGAAKAAWKTADVVSRNPKVAMGVGLGVAGAGAAGAVHHLKKNDDVSSDVSELFAKARVEKGLGGLVDAEKIGATATKVKSAVTNPVNRAVVRDSATFHASNAVHGAKKFGAKVNALPTEVKLGAAAGGVGGAVGGEIGRRNRNKAV